MKVILTIKETPQGHVSIDIESADSQGITKKEACYATNIKDLLQLEIPRLGKALGAKGTIHGTGKPQNS